MSGIAGATGQPTLGKISDRPEVARAAIALGAGGVARIRIVVRRDVLARPAGVGARLTSAAARGVATGTVNAIPRSAGRITHATLAIGAETSPSRAAGRRAVTGVTARAVLGVEAPGYAAHGVATVLTGSTGDALRPARGGLVDTVPLKIAAAVNLIIRAAAVTLAAFAIAAVGGRVAHPAAAGAIAGAARISEIAVRARRVDAVSVATEGAAARAAGAVGLRDVAAITPGAGARLTGPTALIEGAHPSVGAGDGTIVVKGLGKQVAIFGTVANQ